MKELFIVGIGGSTRPSSSTESAISIVLDRATALGCRVAMFDGPALDIPPYDPKDEHRGAKARDLVAAMRAADGLVIGSPGYHGSISGLVKNALDYAEDLRGDDPPYFDGKPVGCLSTAYGWQAAVNTLSTIRQIVHALRGWPTPLGMALNMAAPDGTYQNPKIKESLAIVGEQMVQFARSQGTTLSNVS